MMGEIIMAIRERKGRASPWQVYWNNPITGRREAANFSTRQEAEKHDSMIRHRLRYERESFREAETEEASAPPFESLYLKEKQFDREGLSWQMGAMRLPLRLYGALPLSEIDAAKVASLMSTMSARPVKSATVRGRMSVFRTVLRWCAEHGLCEPIRFPKLPPALYEKLIPPTPEELATILRAAEPHRVRVVILGAQCGVRVGPSELLRLTWDDVDLLQRVLRVHGAKKNPAAPWREVPIRTGLMPLFESWQAEDKRLGVQYLVHYNGRKVASIKTAWRRTLQRAGISRRIRPYDLRHAFATELIAGGVDIGTVAKLMGHSSPAMILNHYQYVMDGQKRAAVEALPEIGNVPSMMCPKQPAGTAWRLSGCPDSQKP